MRRLLLIALLLMLAPGLGAQTSKLDIPYTQFTLPNGLHVILHEDHTVPLVTVNVWYHVGSAREKPGRDRVRASLRAPHVHGLGPRQVRRLRQAPGSRRRQQQRVDRRGPDELLHRRPVERAGPGALPRIRSHGVSARRDVAQDRRRPARRRQERAPRELRERAVRHGVDRDCADALSAGTSLPLAGHRLHGRPDGGQLPGRGGLLQAVLPAGQRQPDDRGRHQYREGPRRRREVVRRRQARRDGDRADRLSASEPDRGQAEDHPGSRAASAPLPDVDYAAPISSRAMRSSTCCRCSWPAARTRVSTSGSSTSCRSRRTSPRSRRRRRSTRSTRSWSRRVLQTRYDLRRGDRPDPRDRGRRDPQDPGDAAVGARVQARDQPGRVLLLRPDGAHRRRSVVWEIS